MMAVRLSLFFSAMFIINVTSSVDIAILTIPPKYKSSDSITNMLAMISVNLSSSLDTVTLSIPSLPPDVTNNQTIRHMLENSKPYQAYCNVKSQFYKPQKWNDLSTVEEVFLSSVPPEEQYEYPNPFEEISK